MNRITVEVFINDIIGIYHVIHSSKEGCGTIELF